METEGTKVPLNKKKKEVHSIGIPELSKIISNDIHIPATDVKLVLDSFVKNIVKFMSMKNTPNDIKFRIRNLGNFVLRPYKGRKKGSIQRKVDFKTGAVSSYIVEEDEPNYYRPFFEPSAKFVAKVRSAKTDGK